MSEQAYERIRQMIVRLDLAPGEVLRDEALQELLGIGRTPVREALQRLERDQFVRVIPRRGVFVSPVDPSELSLLFETRAVMEPFAARLASARGTAEHWADMADAIAAAAEVTAGELDADDRLLDIDRRCHELFWEAADNRFVSGTLDVLYAQSNRVWHLYLADVTDMRHAVEEHAEILDALSTGDADRAAALVERHVRSFDEQVRAAVTSRLAPPLRSQVVSDTT